MLLEQKERAPYVQPIPISHHDLFISKNGIVYMVTAVDKYPYENAVTVYLKEYIPQEDR